MQLMNYYLLSTAFLAAAYTNLLGLNRNLPACAAGVFGVLVSAAFNRLDARTRELVHAAEPALAQLQALLGGNGLPPVDFVVDVRRPKKRWTSYRSTMRFLTSVGAFAFASGTAFALFNR
jgi:hypothetical protein